MQSCDKSRPYVCKEACRKLQFRRPAWPATPSSSQGRPPLPPEQRLRFPLAWSSSLLLLPLARCSGYPGWIRVLASRLQWTSTEQTAHFIGKLPRNEEHNQGRTSMRLALWGGSSGGSGEVRDPPTAGNPMKSLLISPTNLRRKNEGRGGKRGKKKKRRAPP